MGDGYYVDTGRFEMNYGVAATIGNLGWHQTGRSFQGIRFRKELGKGSFVDTFLTQQQDGAWRPAPRFAAGDVYFGGVYAGSGGMVEGMKFLDTYALVRGWAPTAAVGETERASGAFEVTVGTLARAQQVCSTTSSNRLSVRQAQSRHGQYRRFCV